MPDIRKIPLLGRLLPDPDKTPKPQKPKAPDAEESQDVVPSA